MQGEAAPLETMSVSSQQSDHGGGRETLSASKRAVSASRGNGRTPGVDENLLPPFVHHMETKVRSYEREGDIEFPFEDTTGAGDENRVRGNWSSRSDAILALAGFVFGLGNMWRFPFLVYKFGGAAFFIPFIICLFVAAVPIYLLEIALGQFSSLAAISVWKAVPLFKGIGISSVFLSCILAIYLNVVSSWSLYYLASCIGFSLPWSDCENSWNGKNCSTSPRSQCAYRNGTMLANGSCLLESGLEDLDMKSLQFFQHTVLMKSESIDNTLPLNWYLGICLLMAWIAVFLSLFQGVKSSGKVVYVLVILPYIILVVLMARVLTLDGALDGLLYHMNPKWEMLLDAHVWGEAAVHAFYSLSCCTGGLVTLASYNRFHTNFFREVWLIPFLDIACSLAACVLTFSAIGLTAKIHSFSLGTFDLKDGSYLLFVFLSEALSKVHAAPLYAGLFFLMVVMIILSTQIFVVETVVSSICDHYAEKLRKNRRHVLALICLVLLLLSLPFITAAGIYWLTILDRFALRWPLIILAFLEIMAIAWVYGVDNLLDNIKWMSGKYPPVYLFWTILWKYICPAVYMGILAFVWTKWEDLEYGEYTFPYWASIVGWSLSAIPLAIVLVAAIEELANGRGTFCERWRAVLNPDDAWGPALAIHRAEHFPLQIPEARRLLISCEDDFPPSETGWKESREESIAPPRGDESGYRPASDQMSRAATAASVPVFERETAI